MPVTVAALLALGAGFAALVGRMPWRMPSKRYSKVEHVDVEIKITREVGEAAHEAMVAAQPREQTVESAIDAEVCSDRARDEQPSTALEPPHLPAAPPAHASVRHVITQDHAHAQRGAAPKAKPVFDLD